LLVRKLQSELKRGRALMDDWANFLLGKRGDDNVTAA